MSVNIDPIFDYIVLQNGEELYGIVDYVNTKHVYLFVFNNIDNVDYTLMALQWKTSDTPMRFSIFCTVNFPQMELPKVTLLHRKYIEDTSHPLRISKKEKQVKTSIKDQS